MTVRPSAPKMRASRCCMPNSSWPAPLMWNPGVYCGVVKPKSLALIVPSTSAIFFSPIGMNCLLIKRRVLGNFGYRLTRLPRGGDRIARAGWSRGKDEPEVGVRLVDELVHLVRLALVHVPKAHDMALFAVDPQFTLAFEHDEGFIAALVKVVFHGITGAE